MSAIVRVQIEWDGTRIIVESVHDPDSTVEDSTTRTADVAGMLSDCTDRATEAVWNGTNKAEEQ